jgi:hypothetical protein
MSDTQNIFKIGQTTVELATKNRLAAELSAEIHAFPLALHRIAQGIDVRNDGALLAEANTLLDNLIAKGGLNRLKDLASVYKETTARIVELQNLLNVAIGEEAKDL